MLRAIDKAGPYDFATLRTLSNAGSAMLGLCKFGDADPGILRLWRACVDAGAADLVLLTSTSCHFCVDFCSAASQSRTGRAFICSPASPSCKISIDIVAAASQSITVRVEICEQTSQSHKVVFTESQSCTFAQSERELS